jgi:hypothetical protein
VGAPAAEQKEAEAWLTSAFSDHFLTDAFASGHLISGSAGRTICQTFWNDHRAAIAGACWVCAMADGVPPIQAAQAVAAIQAFLSGRAASLLLKTVHDFYNRNGVEVRNALGQAWRTFGDAHLAGSAAGHAETAAMGELASKASRDAVQDVLDTGGTRRAQAALDYIPDVARIGAGGYQPIAGFSTNPTVWTPVLERSLSTSPADNDLYKMVKGNIVPMLTLKARQGARGAGEAAGDTWHSITSIPEEVGRWFEGLERAIEREAGVGG